MYQQVRVGRGAERVVLRMAQTIHRVEWNEGVMMFQPQTRANVLCLPSNLLSAPPFDPVTRHTYTHTGLTE